MIRHYKKINNTLLDKLFLENCFRNHMFEMPNFKKYLWRGDIRIGGNPRASYFWLVHL